MLVRLDGDGPLHQQLCRALRGAILGGSLRPGERLPPSRRLATELEVSRNTVIQAYEQLGAEGYTRSQVGSGTFVAPAIAIPAARKSHSAPATLSRPSVSRAAHRAEHIARTLRLATTAPGPGLRYDFSYGLPWIGDGLLKTWKRLLGRHTAMRAVDYGEPQGLERLREALAGYLRRRRGIHTDPGQIVIVNGAQEALHLTATVLCDPGDAAVLEEPHYPGARHAFRAAGAELIPCTVDDEGLRTADLPRSPARVRLACVTPSHQFPTGGVMPLGRRLELLAWAGDMDACILEDDYDGEYRYDSRPLEALQALDREGRVVYAGSLSKVLFPGLRLGYLVVPDALVDHFVAAKWVADRGCGTIEQAALAECIESGRFERHMRHAARQLEGRRSALLQPLLAAFDDAVGIGGSAAGMHVVLWLPEVRAEVVPELLAAAARRGVGAYPLTPYYVSTPPPAGVLLGYSRLELDEITAGAGELIEALRPYLT